MNVFIVSHHEGVIGVADSIEEAQTMLDAFYSTSGLRYGQPRIEEFAVQTVAEGTLTPGPGSEHLQQAAADFLSSEKP